MNATELLDTLRARNIELRANGENLKVIGPTGSLTEELRDLVRINKAALLAELAQAELAIEGETRDHAKDGRSPLSFAQRRLWFLHQLEGGNLYNIGGNFSVRGGLDLEALQRALNAILARHTVLRTVYGQQNGEPYQVLRSDGTLQIERFVLNGEAAEQERQWRRNCAEFAERPFRLDQDLMLRVGVVDCGADEQRLMIHMHHIASDGWSLSIFIRELNHFYKAFSEGGGTEAMALEPLPMQYADFARRQDGAFRRGDMTKGCAFWRDYLKDLPEVHSLPLDAPRPPQQSYRGGTVNSRLPVDVAQKLGSLARSHGATLFMVLHSAFSLLLSRYSGEDDIVVGTPIAGRDDFSQENLIGCFVNTLVLRARVDSAQPFEQLLRHCRTQLLDAYQYQEVPFEYLVEELKPSRSLQYNPLFQIMFALHNQERTGFSFGKARFASIPQESAATSKFDLSLDAVEGADGVDLVWRYASDLFQAESIARMDRCFRHLLAEIVANPALPMSRLSVVAAEDRPPLPDREAIAAAPLPANLADLFQRQVAAHPARTAMIAPDAAWSYGELSLAADQAAAGLQAAGIGIGDRVGVHLESSAGLVIATLALFKLGAVYVPLDPDYPLSRLLYMVEDSGTRLIVGSRANRARCGELGVPAIAWEDLAATPVPAANGTASQPEHDALAYIIYTSGSSGQPKGVMVSHRNVLSYHAAVQAIYAIGADDRVLQCASPSFDIFIEELAISLYSGAALCVGSRGRQAGRSFWEDVAAQGITVVSLPTAYWHLLCSELGERGNEPAIGASLRLVIAGGEKMSVELLQQWRRSPALAGVRVINTYGPTEATVIATSFDTAGHAADAGDIPIGVALANSHCIVLDQCGEPAAPGAVGELVIAGSSVALGYLGKPGQTEDAFGSIVDTQGRTHRSYRTGDLVRLGADGQLRFIGRRDDQIKISGFRVATGEIERQILKVPGLAMARVLLEGSGAEARLVAALVPEPSALGDGEDTLIDLVHRQVKAALPAYMCPSAYAVMEALPLTANGKIAMERLLAHSFRPVFTTSAIELETDTEKALAGLWAKRLRVEPAAIGRDTSFFEIGGHSLLAIRLLNDIQRTFHKRFGVRQLFETPVLSDLARKIDEQALDLGGQIESDAAAGARAPASFAQKQLWYLEQIGPATGAYNITGLRRFQGELDLRLAEQALSWLLARHGALRTRFEEHGEELWQSVDDAPALRMDVIDAFSVPATLRKTLIHQEVQARARRPFDLRSGALVRVAAIVEEQATSLAWAVHHIAADGWSIDLFWREFDQAYARLAAGAGLPEMTRPLQYIDYSRWQSRQLQQGAWQASIDYWKRQLQDLPLLHELPTDMPRPESQRFDGASYVWALSEHCRRGLEALAARTETSLFMLFHAAFALLLARRTGATDIVIGTPASNRHRPEVADTIGLLANLVVLRAEVHGGQPFVSFLQHVKQVNIEALEHQEIPFQCLVEALNPERSAAFNPLVQIIIGIDQDGSLQSPAEPRLSEEEVAKFDLSLNIAAGSGGTAVELNYDRSLYSPRTVIGLAEQLTALLDDIVARPETAVGELALLGADEQARLLRHASRASHSGSEPGDLLYVLDAQGRLVPYGFEGELHLGGARAQAVIESGALQPAISNAAIGPVLPTGKRVRFDHEGRLVASNIASQRYWSGLLRGAAPRHGLPILEAGLQQHVREGAVFAWELPPDVARRLDALARRRQGGILVLMAAGLGIAMSRYSGETRTVLAVCGPTRAPVGLEQLLADTAYGLLRPACTATLEIDDYLSALNQQWEDSWRYREGLDAVLAGRPTQETPFNPVAQILLAMHAAPLATDGATLSGMDIVLSVKPDDQQFGLAIGYRAALFPSWLIEQMAEDLSGIFAQLADGAVQRLRDVVLPSQSLPLPAPPADAHADAAHCLHVLFERQAVRTPQRIALRFGTQELDYASLNARANQLAHALAAAGVRPGALVGVCLPRSLELVVALLAVLKAGAAYVPMDPDYPTERLRYIAADAGLGLILGTASTRTCVEGIDARLLDVSSATAFTGFASHDPALEIAPSSLAYLIYTSGTTGRPKGVMIEHRNAAEMLAWAHATYTAEQLAVVLASTSICFDLSVFEMFAPLTGGGCCLLVGHILDLHQSAQVRGSGVTLINTVPSAIVQLLDAGAIPESVQVVNLAGEALLAPVVEQVYAQTAVQAVYNLYGPSEDTTYSTYALCRRGSGRAPDIGIPIRGCQAFVVDGQGQIAPRGVAGELYLGGTGLSPGYWQRPELTAEKFVPGASIGVALPRLYRTGDLVRWSERGVLEFIGRLDQQVKLNGFRIELGEIEAALAASGVVKASAVLKVDDAQGQRLVAFVQYLAGQGETEEASEARAREFLRGHLPGFMLPQEWIGLQALALSANGKIDRNALRAWYASQRSDAPAAREVQAARNTTEQWIVALWQRLLKVEPVGIGDNFFALGGRSLLALQVVNAINRQFGCQLSMVDVFKHPTVGELAGQIDTPPATAVAAASVAPPSASVPSSAFALAPLPRVPARVTEYPASSAQTAMWLVDRMANGSSHYNVPFATATGADFDVQVAEGALLWLIARHEPLRTVFSDDDGTLLQRVLPMERVVLEFEHRSFDGASDAAWRDALATASRQQAHHCFDLQHDTLLRGVHLQRDGHGWLLLNAHHIALDGWSISIFWSEFAQACAALAAGREPALPPLQLRYIDYTAWQDIYLASPAAERSRAYWRDQLNDLPPRHGLPMLEEGQHYAGSAGESYRWRLPAETGRKLEALAARQSVSTFMLVHAALSILVARYSGNRDVVIGTPTANRAMSEFEPIVGLFANTLVLRTDCDAGQTLAGYLEQVRRVNLEAFEHQHLPFESLVELLNPPRSECYAPLFQILLTTDIEGRQERASSAGGTGFSDDSQEKVDLACHVSLNEDAFHVTIGYRQPLFPRWLIEQMAEDLTGIFAQLADGAVQRLRDVVLPSQPLPLPAPPADAHADAAHCLHVLFERQAVRTPQRIALRFGTQELDYASLNARANQLAHALAAAGVRPGALVGVCLPRSLELVVALLAVLKAGAAYVPMDPDYPTERLRYIAADAGLGLILGNASTRTCVEGIDARLLDVSSATAFASFASHDPALEIAPSSLAYLIYTSGTTGRPKGVMIEHRNAAEMLAWAHATYTAEQLAVVLASTSICFDLSVFEMFAPLTGGGCCLLVGHILDLHQSAQVRDSGVTLINTVPSAIVQLLDAGAIPESVQVVNLAGEALLAPVVEQVYAQTAVQAVYNLYGPSEDTTYSTYALCRRGSGRAPDIGIPIRGCQAFVVDGQGQIAPRGVAGELYLGGTGLSPGYWQRPELTAEKFVPGASIGVALPRLYRTGDLVRWSERGVLEFIGRLDQQVKLNGFRIELGEIEAALAASGVVKASAVLKVDDAQGQRLVAFVQYLAGQGETEEASEARAREFLRGHLPGFMLPQEWIGLQALALSANGKIDRNALRAWYASQRSDAPAAREVQAARNTTEQWIVALWQRLLKVEPVGIGDNFFALGGRSLLALQVVNAINRQFGCQLSMVDVFKHPTVGELAGQVGERMASPASSDACVLVQLQRGRRNDRRQAPKRLILIHPIGGDVGCYHELVARFDPEWEVLGIQMSEEHDLSIEQLAQRYVALLRSVQPDGPYHLAGFSLGGLLAFEMAGQLEADGQLLGSVSLIDSMLIHGTFDHVDADLVAFMVLLQELGVVEEQHVAELQAVHRVYGVERALAHATEHATAHGLLPAAVGVEALRERFRLCRSNWTAASRYPGRPYTGAVQFIGATVDAMPWEQRGWDALAAMQVAPALECDHFQILRTPHVDRVAAWLAETVQRTSGPLAELEEV